MSFSYANPTSGPSAGGIGWFNFGDLTINPNQTITGFTGTLNDGSTVTFDMTLIPVSGTPRAFISSTVPTFANSQFGVAGYTGLAGKPAMYSDLINFRVNTSTIIISNITVKDVNNNIVPNFSVLIADAERTNLFEQIQGQTNGGVWSLFTTVGTGGIPTLTGMGTQNFSIIGVQRLGQMVSYVLETASPSQIDLTFVQNDPVVTRQGFAIGFATTTIKLQKYVAGRINDNDQFQLDISGIPGDVATTSGLSSGLQVETAEIFAVPNNNYVINEIMAPGSVSNLSDYTTIVSASNMTPAGSVPPIGNIPITFTPELGDAVIYTIYNSIPETYVKTVDKAYADIGEVLSYTVVISNENDFPVNNVQFNDSTPTGTTYIGNLIVSKPYTGTDPATGLLITSIPANDVVTISWQVQVNTVPPISTPVVNLAEVIIPGGNSGVTNMVTTEIRTAYVTVMKAVDKIVAKPNDLITYTLTISNAGNVPAYNVVITDGIPQGTTLVNGSISGATGTLPTLTLNAPLAAGSTTTVTYQLKVGSAIPVTNPITNSASLVYEYTVDPAQPLGITKTAQSNLVETMVKEAKLSVVKSSNKTISYIGDTITYQIAVKNNGNVPANNVVLTDVLTTGTAYIPGTLSVNVPATGDPNTAIILTNPIAAGQTVSIIFKVIVTNIPNPNPIVNIAIADFTYTIDEQNPDGESGSIKSNKVQIIVFRNKFNQEINDIIRSVAEEQAALSAIVNSEGAKIQRMAAIQGISTEELLSLNKSVFDMMESITMLEYILKQKIDSINCQINGNN